jgi:hypothetical protein
MGGGSHRRRLGARGGDYPREGDQQASDEPGARRARRAELNDLGQRVLTVTAAGRAHGSRDPALVIEMLIGGRHQASRYGSEVNVP